jgi:uncharacterized protein YhfF
VSFATLADLHRARPDLADAGPAEIAFPGALRDRLVAAYLAGEKTAGSCLLTEFALEGLPLPAIGSREVMVDSEDRPVGLLVVTGVEVSRLADVGLRVAQAEGEGFTSITEWREAHVDFWTSPEMRRMLGDQVLPPDDETMIVVTWFVVAERFD